MLRKSDDGKCRVLSLSYGKDSIATIRACEILGLPLDRIITADVWATETIPADLPPMWEFKKKADEIIFGRWGIKVEHIHATRGGVLDTYERYFYGERKTGNYIRNIIGFPMQRIPWCNSRLKMAAITAAEKTIKDSTTGGIVHYIGIAADEPIRIARHINKPNVVLPLVQIGWDEALCGLEAKYMGLLSPVYETGTRDGCWFCHNQSVGQMRNLRKNYPDLWNLLLKWDKDSPVTFKADGHTVHDYDRRFALEDDGLICRDDRFSWSMLDAELNYRFF